MAAQAPQQGASSRVRPTVRLTRTSGVRRPHVQPDVPQVTHDERNWLAGMTAKELRAKARDLSIPYYARKSKAELIEAILEVC